MGGCQSSDKVIEADKITAAKPPKELFHDKYRCYGKWEEDIKAEHDKLYEEIPESFENMEPLTVDGLDEY